MSFAVLVVFALTYAGISARRLSLLPIGRPAIATVGAVVCVVLSMLDPVKPMSLDAALVAIEPHTMVLLLGMMIVAAGFARAGFFEWAAAQLDHRFKQPLALLAVVTFGAGYLSAVLLNDAVCLLLTPLIVAVALRRGLPLLPFVLATAMGANAGSALLLSGNPQNMLVAKLSALSFAHYARFAFVPAHVALLTVVVLLALRFGRGLRIAAPSTTTATTPALDRPLLWASSLGLCGMVIANVCGAPLALSAMAAASVVLLAARKNAEQLLLNVDFSVLLFFAALFVLVACLQHTGYPQQWLQHYGSGGGIFALVVVLLLGSQIVSNVPLILLLSPFIAAQPDPTLAWSLTALVSTLAGNLTLLGSVANVIVIERTNAECQARGQPAPEVGFFSYLQTGLPATLIAVALCWLTNRS